MQIYQKTKRNKMSEQEVKEKRNAKDAGSKSQRISGDWFDSAIEKDLPHIIKGKKIPSDNNKDEKNKD